MNNTINPKFFLDMSLKVYLDLHKQFLNSPVSSATSQSFPLNKEDIEFIEREPFAPLFSKAIEEMIVADYIKEVRELATKRKSRSQFPPSLEQERIVQKLSLALCFNEVQ